MHLLNFVFSIECCVAGLDPQTSEVPKNLGKEIDLAFANVEAALKAAGGKGWEQVYKVRSYHIPLDEEALEHTVRNLKKYTPNHRPLVTVVGVTSLAIPGMRIEIEVEADVR